MSGRYNALSGYLPFPSNCDVLRNVRLMSAQAVGRAQIAVVAEA